MTIMDAPPIEDIDLSTIVGSMTVSHLGCFCCTATACQLEEKLRLGDDAWSEGDVKCSACEERERIWRKGHLNVILHTLVCQHNRRST